MLEGSLKRKKFGLSLKTSKKPTLNIVATSSSAVQDPKTHSAVSSISQKPEFSQITLNPRDSNDNWLMADVQVVGKNLETSKRTKHVFEYPVFSNWKELEDLPIHKVTLVEKSKPCITAPTADLIAESSTHSSLSYTDLPPPCLLCLTRKRPQLLTPDKWLFTDTTEQNVNPSFACTDVVVLSDEEDDVWKDTDQFWDDVIEDIPDMVGTDTDIKYVKPHQNIGSGDVGMEVGIRQHPKERCEENNYTRISASHKTKDIVIASKVRQSSSTDNRFTSQHNSSKRNDIIENKIHIQPQVCDSTGSTIHNQIKIHDGTRSTVHNQIKIHDNTGSTVHNQSKTHDITKSTIHNQSKIHSCTGSTSHNESNIHDSTGSTAHTQSNIRGITGNTINKSKIYESIGIKQSTLGSGREVDIVEARHTSDSRLSAKGSVNRHKLDLPLTQNAIEARQKPNKKATSNQCAQRPASGLGHNSKQVVQKTNQRSLNTKTKNEPGALKSLPNSSKKQKRPELALETCPMCQFKFPPSYMKHEMERHINCCVEADDIEDNIIFL